MKTHSHQRTPIKICLTSHIQILIRGNLVETFCIVFYPTNERRREEKTHWQIIIKQISVCIISKYTRTDFDKNVQIDFSWFVIFVGNIGAGDSNQDRDRAQGTRHTRTGRSKKKMIYQWVALYPSSALPIYVCQGLANVSYGPTIWKYIIIYVCIWKCTQ